MSCFNRWDICEAFWHFAAEYHPGRGSAEYQVFSRLHRLRFKAGVYDKRHMTENGRSILAGMIRQWRNGKSPVRGGTPRGPVKP